MSGVFTKRTSRNIAMLIIIQLALVGALSALATRGSVSAQSYRAAGLLPRPSSAPSNLVAVGDTLFFTADDGVHGRELWKSDGTPQRTVLVSDIRPGILSSSPGELTDMEGTLFFAADDGVHGRELWKSDGTAQGTVLVRDIKAFETGSQPYELTNVRGRLFFVVDGGIYNLPDLWISDGTTAGTLEVIDFGRLVVSLTDFTAIDDTLFFIMKDILNPEPFLYKSDGTKGGTTMLISLSNFQASWLEPVGATLFFARDDGLWKSNGTLSNTIPVRSGDMSPRYLHDLTNVEGTLFFGARHFDGKDWILGLWKSDGTEAGTVRVKEFANLAPFSADTQQFIAVDGTLFFVLAGNENPTTVELWKSDGTETGTLQFATVLRPTPHDPIAINSTLFFGGVERSHGDELWKSDGTTEGTVRIADIYPGAASSKPSSFASMGGILFFAADDGVHGRELWKSDGTEAGTMLVQDIRTHYTFFFPLVRR